MDKKLKSPMQSRHSINESYFIILTVNSIFNSTHGLSLASIRILYTGWET